LPNDFLRAPDLALPTLACDLNFFFGVWRVDYKDFFLSPLTHVIFCTLLQAVLSFSNQPLMEVCSRSTPVGQPVDGA